MNDNCLSIRNILFYSDDTLQFILFWFLILISKKNFIKVSYKANYINIVITLIK